MQSIDPRAPAEVHPVTRFAVPFGVLLFLGCSLACSDTNSPGDETSTSTNQGDDTASGRDEDQREESDDVGEEANDEESEPEAANSVDDDQASDRDIGSSSNSDGRAMEVADDGDRDAIVGDGGFDGEGSVSGEGSGPRADEAPVENGEAMEASTIAETIDEDGASFADICDEICTTQEEIGCPNDIIGEECIDRCDEGAGLLASNECASEYTKWVRCLTADVETNFFCDEDGHSTPVDEACNTELEAMDACLEELSARIGDDRALRRVGSLRLLLMP